MVLDKDAMVLGRAFNPMHVFIMILNIFALIFVLILCFLHILAVSTFPLSFVTLFKFPLPHLKLEI